MNLGLPSPDLSDQASSDELSALESDCLRWDGPLEDARELECAAGARPEA